MKVTQAKHTPPKNNRQSETPTWGTKTSPSRSPERKLGKATNWGQKKNYLPSGKYFGYYKTLMEDNDFAEFFIIQCTLPLQYKFAPDRWAHSVQLVYRKNQTCQHKKKSGLSKSTRQTIISSCAQYGTGASYGTHKISSKQR